MRRLRLTGSSARFSLPEVKKSVDRGNQWDMAKFTATLAPIELFERNLISADHQTAIITLVIDARADKDAAINAVRRLIADHGQDLRPVPDRHAAGVRSTGNLQPGRIFSS